MATPSLDDRYSRGAIAFHWIIAALILFNLWLGLFHESLPREWKVMPVHKATGITILVLSIGRLIWRLTHRPPHLPLAMPGWEKTLAKATHWIFYALLIVMPLTGWAMSSTGNPPRPLNWYGLFPIPYLPVPPAIGDASHDAHTVLGYLMAVLVAVHIAAAFRHHWMLRDAVLWRMAPILRRP
jgi:cytochrome b561